MCDNIRRSNQKKGCDNMSDRKYHIETLKFSV